MIDFLGVGEEDNNLTRAHAQGSGFRDFSPSGWYINMAPYSKDVRAKDSWQLRIEKTRSFD